MDLPGPDGQPLGYRPLPPLNIACSGQGVVGSKEDWARFANGDGRFREGMERLYDLFQKAPTLGSLIDPRTVAEDLFALGFDTLKGTVERALKKIETRDDPDRAALGVAAQGIALAASLMSREFTLVATNVPYLARGKQAALRDYLRVHPAAKADLATAFVERCLEYCAEGGSTALVTPQNWLFLGSYKTLREWMLRQVTWNVVAKLGPAAFEDMNWWAANTMLSIHTATEPEDGHELVGLEASGPRAVAEKAACLRTNRLQSTLQSDQLRNPNAVVSFASYLGESLLSKYVTVYQGVSTGDGCQYCRKFWELPQQNPDWEYFHESPERANCLGMTGLLHTQQGCGPLSRIGTARKGLPAKGKNGVAIAVTGHLPRVRFFGNRFDGTIAAMIPNDPSDLAAVVTFVKSDQFIRAVSEVDQALSVTESSFIKVPFDLERWQQVATEEYPNGLPEPHSDDPTQWLFKGHPKGSTDPLEVAVARLLGHRWPDQKPDSLDALSDADGIVPIPSVRGEPPAAERLREVLKRAGSQKAVTHSGALAKMPERM